MRKGDTLAWATGTRVGASDHAIALFCILYGRVLGLLDFTFTLYCGLIVRIIKCTFVFVVILWRTL